MKVSELFNFLKEKGTWVNWKRTSDHILFGDPNSDIKGIALGWMATLPNLKKAYFQGCNLYITHEPLYLAWPNQFDIYIGGPFPDYQSLGVNGIPVDEDDIWVEKAEWLKSHEMTIVRCHDVWDDFPEIGIHGAWANWLGFTDKPVEIQKFYEIHDVGETTLKEILRKIQSPLKELGQDAIHYIGVLEQKVHRVAFGTGAITDYRLMFNMGADCLILTDDGTKLWESGQWADDSGVAIIYVNHATAEEPGMRALAKYLSEQFPEEKFQMIERGCLYKTF